jgi:hypothetical protein
MNIEHRILNVEVPIQKNSHFSILFCLAVFSRINSDGERIGKTDDRRQMTECRFLTITTDYELRPSSSLRMTLITNLDFRFTDYEFQFPISNLNI